MVLMMPVLESGTKYRKVSSKDGVVRVSSLGGNPEFFVESGCECEVQYNTGIDKTYTFRGNTRRLRTSTFKLVASRNGTKTHVPKPAPAPKPEPAVVTKTAGQTSTTRATRRGASSPPENAETTVPSPSVTSLAPKKVKAPEAHSEPKKNSGLRRSSSQSVARPVRINVDNDIAERRRQIVAHM
jgi:hypothetical protein